MNTCETFYSRGCVVGGVCCWGLFVVCWSSYVANPRGDVFGGSGIGWDCVAVVVWWVALGMGIWVKYLGTLVEAGFCPTTV